jgi:hypothetical protein
MEWTNLSTALVENSLVACLQLSLEATLTLVCQLISGRGFRLPALLFVDL